MDGGGDRQRSVHFVLSQENRRRVPSHQRNIIHSRFAGIIRAARADRSSDPNLDGDPESTIFITNLDRHDEDSGFESGSDGN